MRPVPLRLQRRDPATIGRPVLGAEKQGTSGHMIAANATATIELHGAKQKRRSPHARTPWTPPHADILGIAQRSPASGRGNLRVFSAQERTESRAGADERCRSRKVRCLRRNAQIGPGLRVVALIAPGKPRADPMTASTSSQTRVNPKSVLPIFSKT